MTNQQIADQLLHQARLWSAQHTNLFRVRAYRQAAMTAMGLRREMGEILDSEGKTGLIELPGIGIHLADDIAHFIRGGVWNDSHSRKSPRIAG